LVDKGDKRVFYLKPTNNIFLEEPRKQNQFRNNFVRMISAPPSPEPLTLMADDMYKVTATHFNYPGTFGINWGSVLPISCKGGAM
jgi:hypothetical protein